MIDLQVGAGTSSIELHSLGLSIVKPVVTTATTTEDVQRWTTDLKRQTITFHLSTALAEGAATLDIGFAGELSDRLCGFYRSKYVVDGETRSDLVQMN